MHTLKNGMLKQWRQTANDLRAAVAMPVASTLAVYSGLHKLYVHRRTVNVFQEFEHFNNTTLNRWQ